MHHWVGDSAKARVIALILSDPRRKLKVLDYGAGMGADWPEVLGTQANLDLVCLEPDPEATRAVRSKSTSDRVRVLTPQEIVAETVAADYIVRFSVLEHVVDKPTYMRQAKCRLGRDGTFLMGDSINLCGEMASRTRALRHG